jgi:hypothetical protein
MNSFKPRRVESLRGKVIRDSYGKGTKSEHDAILIITGEGRYLLRRKDGPAFNDVHLEKYLGLEIECDGFLVDSTLIAEHLKVVG